MIDSPVPAPRGRLILEDGTVFEGVSFGHQGPSSGEVVFSTGMVGYPEALSDPSFRGQILVLTYPLVGNYGVPADDVIAGDPSFESSVVQVAGLVVGDYSPRYSHWFAGRSLSEWLAEHRVPGLSGIDTRAITKRLREHGSMLGRIDYQDESVAFCDPNSRRIVEEVSVRAPEHHGSTGRRILMIDCGVKNSILHNLLTRGFQVKVVPWNHDLRSEEFDGIVVSSGPGDPKLCGQTIGQIRQALQRQKPFLGICLGHQLLGLAIGADTFKLKYGHRSQNQPVQEANTGRCYVTSQNHGYAVDQAALPEGWYPWFVNLNDGTNEGLRHRTLPFMSVQFHPEASPGPVDTLGLFDEYAELVNKA
jgi:carbamoyl-phosphate synthase small subunit